MTGMSGGLFGLEIFNFRIFLGRKILASIFFISLRTADVFPVAASLPLRRLFFYGQLDLSRNVLGI